MFPITAFVLRYWSRSACAVISRKTEEGSAVRAAIRQETVNAAWILASLLDVSDGGPSALLRQALLDEFEQSRRRCILLLSFLYSSASILRAGRYLFQKASDQRAYALEIVDSTVSGHLKRDLLALFESRAPAECLDRLIPWFPQSRLDQESRLREIIAWPHAWVHPWIRTCAIFAAAESEITGCAAHIRSALADPSPIVRETVAWALYKQNRPAYLEQVGMLEEDPSPQVRQLVEKLERSIIGENTMLLTVERTMILKSVEVFAGVPDEVLANLAGALEESEVPGGNEVYAKGGMGRTM